jgi:hypothetical protein
MTFDHIPMPNPMRLLLIASTVLAYAAPSAAFAQPHASGMGSTATVPTTSAKILVAQLSTPLPDGAKAFILRRVNETPTNVIVVGSDADAIALGAAITTLRAARASEGDSLGADERIVIRSAAATGVGPKLQRALDHEIERLGRAPTRQLAGVGTVRAVERTLPRPKTSDRRR